MFEGAARAGQLADPLDQQPRGRHDEQAFVVAAHPAGQLLGGDLDPERDRAPTGGVPSVDQADRLVGDLVAIEEGLGFEGVVVLVDQQIVIVGRGVTALENLDVGHPAEGEEDRTQRELDQGIVGAGALDEAAAVLAAQGETETVEQVAGGAAETVPVLLLQVVGQAGRVAQGVAVVGVDGDAPLGGITAQLAEVVLHHLLGLVEGAAEVFGHADVFELAHRRPPIEAAVVWRRVAAPFRSRCPSRASLPDGLAYFYGSSRQCKGRSVFSTTLNIPNPARLCNAGQAPAASFISHQRRVRREEYDDKERKKASSLFLLKILNLHTTSSVQHFSTQPCTRQAYRA